MLAILRITVFARIGGVIETGHAIDFENTRTEASDSNEDIFEYKDHTSEASESDSSEGWKNRMEVVGTIAATWSIFCSQCNPSNTRNYSFTKNKTTYNFPYYIHGKI
ncbi:hypothetical protein QE152_g4641 [Popillia japonica]|uniref:Uncharacterized protein n=1 Tax=Popillia japonica TaxID=7064 RepID=A0AAW1MZN2_POPJA